MNRVFMKTVSSVKPFSLVIFGASGDLAHRKLFPAVFELYLQGLLGESFSVIGYARSEKSRGDFVEFFRTSLSDHGKKFEEESQAWERFAAKLEYVSGAYDTQDGFIRLAQLLESLEARNLSHGNRVFHFSTPPQVFDDISTHLSELNMAVCTPGGICSRIVIEKPFGRDLASARELNRRLNKAFLEKQIYRIDHYLGKETVQNILSLRFTNVLLESVWNHRYIDHVQITVAESLGIGSRGGYYDQLGCTRDMVQNHLCQLLCITAMEPPNYIDSDEVRDEKVKVLKAIRPFEGCFDQCAVRGQYGSSADGSAKGYRSEEGVLPHSTTETFAACKLFVDNWRWAGVPFYLRTGKCMSSRRSEIFLQFKEIPKNIFSAQQSLAPDGVLMRLQPDEGVSFVMKAKVPGPEMNLRSVEMGFDYATSFAERSADAYERLIYDAILDKPALFIRADETETSWALFDPLLNHWRDTPPGDFPNYAALSDGPAAAEELLKRDGRRWFSRS
ncbi:MAG: glucose-6-phosphate dehydrogenase [Planctomycetes bacterium]|nr:glucose-6-phosphate dehydrogenase [Planctomycetota bacterium]